MDRERFCDWSAAVRELLGLRAERLGIDCESWVEGGGWGESELSEIVQLVQLFCFKRLRSFNSSEGLVQIYVGRHRTVCFLLNRRPDVQRGCQLHFYKPVATNIVLTVSVLTASRL